MHSSSGKRRRRLPLIAISLYPFQLWRDFWLIKKHNVFQAYCYKKRYLKESLSHWFALLHYLLIGERRGHWPNAFFDPTHFAKAQPRKPLRSSFAEYLRAVDGRAASPSANFLHAWYCQQNPDWQKKYPHPFVHFWHKGLFEKRHPSPDLDIDFFCHTAGRGHGDIKIVLYDALASASSSVPLNQQELSRRQKKFYESISLQIVRAPPKPNNPFLVFVQASRKYQCGFLDDARGFDLMINYYDGCGKTEVCPDADYILCQKGTKTTAIRKILAERPELLEKYEAVLFLDDDIEINQAGIMRIFSAMKACGLDLAQPALTPDSDCYFAVVKHPPPGQVLVPLTAVEIMMPAVSHRVLREFGWVFAQGTSGWAIDFLLSAKVRKRYGNKIALIADVIARHDRPRDVESGAFYRYMKSHGIDPNIEAGYVAWKYGIDDSILAISQHAQPLDFS
ncbi:MAG TPA: hypothetical protein VEK34_01155 [Methylocella sp.]|nr:hypothetical protein [Methylocella sp.]